MQRVFLKDITRPDGTVFVRKGDVRDYPMETWAGIVKSLFPKFTGNAREKLDSFSQAVADIGNMITDKRVKA